MEATDILGEGLYVGVVADRILLKHLPIKKSFIPILVKGVIQDGILGNNFLDRLKDIGISHDFSFDGEVEM